MRIGQPAWKHDVSEEDIPHAPRNALRRIDLDENLTMLIGPELTGGCWRSESWISRARTRSSSTPWS